MVPDEVWSDPRLEHRDIRLYCFLASARRGCYASVGQRRLAKLAHCDRRGVRESIRALVDAGHLQEKHEGRGRSRYKMLSRWFVGKAGSVEVAPPAVEQKPMVRCPKCGKACHGLLRCGWCRSCNWELKVKRIVRGELADGRMAS